MATERAGGYRSRATQARRISANMQNCKAQTELRDMADALDAEAERLEHAEEPEPAPPPTDDSDKRLSTPKRRIF